MKEYTTKFNSKYDNLPLDCLITEPDNIKAIVLFAHGMAENKERYLDFMRFLSEYGYLCIINDHRGHGNSIKGPDDLGYFYDDSGKYVVDDIHDIGVYYKHKYNVPVYLFGHSMGSLIVRIILKKYDRDIDKLIVCGSPSANPAAKLAIGVVNSMMKFKGDRYRSPFIADLALGGYQKRFDEKIENTWLSVNRQNVIDYNASDKCGFNFTLNGYMNLFKIMDDVYNKKGWKVTKPSLPIYFIAGEDDPCIDTYDKWMESQKFLFDLGYTNISNTLYPNMRHEILLEDDKQSVYNDVLQFLEK